MDTIDLLIRKGYRIYKADKLRPAVKKYLSGLGLDAEYHETLKVIIIRDAKG
jgi:hypothetical protein